MQDEPRPDELVKAVADFLRNDITPQLSGHAAFKLRVAINSLDLVTRQLTLEGESNASEAARLSAILGIEAALQDLNRSFSERIASGEIDPEAAGVKDHLWQTTMEKLAVDQPNYAAYRREFESKKK
jgi:hypothetical protein